MLKLILHINNMVLYCTSSESVQNSYMYKNVNIKD